MSACLRNMYHKVSKRSTNSVPFGLLLSWNQILIQTSYVNDFRIVLPKFLFERIDEIELNQSTFGFVIKQSKKQLQHILSKQNVKMFYDDDAFHNFV